MQLTKAAVVLLAVAGSPAFAQDSPDMTILRNSLTSSINSDPALKLQRRGFSFPVVEYSEPTGTRQLRKGIIAGTQVAPETIVGLGLFETAPKARHSSPETDPSVRPKKSRQAAVGLSWRF